MEPGVAKEQWKFTREFKLEAVRLIRERGVSVAQSYVESRTRLEAEITAFRSR